MTIAEYIANQLFSIGIRFIFGIPGGPSIPYIEAFRAVGITFILTSNEASAAIMADVSARLTGIPGVCHSTFGPGATNISTGVAGALLDRSPVIVFTSEMDDTMVNRTTQMNINHQKLFNPITKATYRMNAGNVKDILDSAIKLCMEEYPGPVHIGLPSDIANIKINKQSDRILEPEKKIYDNDIQNAVSLIKKSKKPLIAIGLTAARLGIQPDLLKFLEIYKVPVVITPMAKGLIPEDHPCYTGVLFHSLSNYLEDICKKCDLIIGLGYDPVEYNYESWIPDVPLIHFDTVKTDMPSKGTIVQINGPKDDWFKTLRNMNRDSIVSEHSTISSIREKMESLFSGLTTHFGPAAALKALQEELPEDVILTCDVGSHLHLAGQFWKTYGKGKIIMTNGWSGMGFGIPAAMAAQLNNMAATVVCITGDGGFLMMAGEIITARRNKLQVIFVVFSDGELNLIKVKQSWKKVPYSGTNLYDDKLFGTDTFLGIKVYDADSATSMKSALNNALKIKEPAIINTIIDPDDYNKLIVKR